MNDTDPYLVSGLSVLIDKNRLIENGIRTIEDLLNENSKIVLGTIRSSFIHSQLNTRSDLTRWRVHEHLYTNNIMSNNSIFVDNREDGINRTLNEQYALIQETINNELAIDKYCGLTQLPLGSDDNPKLQIENTIVMQESSKHIDTFNKAIRELKLNGKLAQLKRRYWNRKCTSSKPDKDKHSLIQDETRNLVNKGIFLFPNLVSDYIIIATMYVLFSM